MSLFGSGRREGALAAGSLAALALLVHVLGAWAGLADGLVGDPRLAAAMATAHGLVARGELPLWDPIGPGAPLWTRGAELLYPCWWLLGLGRDALWAPLLAALHTAIACMLAFRFLRAQGRSRYAAFLGGAAYGLGAHMGSLGGHFAELAAVAWAPLPLEAMLRYARSREHRLAGAAIAPALVLVYATGGTVTALCVTVTVLVWLLRRALRDPSRRLGMLTTAAFGAAAAACCTAPLWLCLADYPAAVQPVPPVPPLGEALRRVVGPLLVFLSALGLLRHQRHAPGERWLPIALLGAACGVLLPFVPWPLSAVPPWLATPIALWWPLHLAFVVLAASGLDDFLDQPMRRQSASAWLLLGCAAAPVLGWLGGADSPRFHLESAVLLALALLFAVWRWLGILGFKTVFASAALVWLAAATLHEQARGERTLAPIAAHPSLWTGAPLPASPALEHAALLPSDPHAQLVFTLTADAAPLDAPLLLPRAPQRAVAVHGLPPDFVCRPSLDPRVRRLDDRATALAFAAELGAGQGALLVDRTFARGWQATVDGAPSPVLRSDLGAQVVLLGPGSHRVELRYQPIAVRRGPVLAALGGLLVLAQLWWAALRTFARAR